MSANGPIPASLRAEFIGYMDAGYNDDDAPDGAWFARMENDARDFMREHKLRGDENDAVHQLLEWMQPSAQEDQTPAANEARRA